MMGWPTNPLQAAMAAAPVFQRTDKSKVSAMAQQQGHIQRSSMAFKTNESFKKALLSIKK